MGNIQIAKDKENNRQEYCRRNKKHGKQRRVEMYTKYEWKRQKETSRRMFPFTVQRSSIADSTFHGVPESPFPLWSTCHLAFYLHGVINYFCIYWSCNSGKNFYFLMCGLVLYSNSLVFILLFIPETSFWWKDKICFDNCHGFIELFSFSFNFICLSNVTFNS